MSPGKHLCKWLLLNRNVYCLGMAEVSECVCIKIYSNYSNLRKTPNFLKTIVHELFYKYHKYPAMWNIFLNHKPYFIYLRVFFFLFRNSSDNKRTKDNTTIQIIKHIKNNHTKKTKPYLTLVWTLKYFWLLTWDGQTEGMVKYSMLFAPRQCTEHCWGTF